MENIKNMESIKSITNLWWKKMVQNMANMEKLDIQCLLIKWLQKNIEIWNQFDWLL